MTDLKQDKALQAYVERLRDYLISNSNSVGRITRKVKKPKSDICVQVSGTGKVVQVTFTNCLGGFYYCRWNDKGFTSIYGDTTTAQNIRKQLLPSAIATVLKKKIREFFPNAINNTNATMRWTNPNREGKY